MKRTAPMSRAEYAAARRVACPTCGVPAGVDCRDRYGRELSFPHSTRCKRAEPVTMQFRLPFETP